MPPLRFSLRRKIDFWRRRKYKRRWTWHSSSFYPTGNVRTATIEEMVEPMRSSLLRGVALQVQG